MVGCDLYTNKAENLNTLREEASLEKIASDLKKASRLGSQIVLPGENKVLKLVDVFPQRNSVEEAGQIGRVYEWKKLDETHEKTIKISAPFNECLRKCRSSELNSCTMFSHCGASDECLVSGAYFGKDDLEKDILQDNKNCSTFVFTPISFFRKKEEGRFKFHGSMVKDYKPGEKSSCARYCLHENQCHGFALCQSSESQWCEFFNISSPLVLGDQKQWCTLYKRKFIPKLA